MEDKIFDIVTDLLREEISKEEAINKLLILHNNTCDEILEQAANMYCPKFSEYLGPI